MKSMSIVDMEGTAIANLMDIVTKEGDKEPIVKTDANGNITSDGFCRFSDDYQGIFDCEHNFHSCDRFDELSTEFGNPLALLEAKEHMMGAPIALCSNSTLTTVIMH